MSKKIWKDVAYETRMRTYFCSHVEYVVAMIFTENNILIVKMLWKNAHANVQ